LRRLAGHGSAHGCTQARCPWIIFSETPRERADQVAIGVETKHLEAR
jgi:hypothetical protein